MAHVVYLGAVSNGGKLVRECTKPAGATCSETVLPVIALETGEAKGEHQGRVRRCTAIQAEIIYSNRLLWVDK